MQYLHISKLFNMINKIDLALKHGVLLLEFDEFQSYPKEVLTAFKQELGRYGYCISPGDRYLHYVNLSQILEFIRESHKDIRPLFPSFPIVHNLVLERNVYKLKSLKPYRLSGFIKYLMQYPKKTREDIEFLSQHNILYEKILEVLDEGGRFKKISREKRREILGFLELSLDDTYLEDSKLFIKLGEKLHPGEYKNIFPHCYKFFRTLRRVTPNSWENDRKKAYDEGGVIGEAKFIKDTDPSEFLIRFESLMSKAYREKHETQMLDLLIDSELSYYDLLKLLKTYEISDSLGKYKVTTGRTYGRVSPSGMAEYLRYIIISKLSKYQGTIKNIKPSEEYKKLSVTSLLNTDSLNVNFKNIKFDKPVCIRFSTSLKFPVDIEEFSSTSQSSYIAIIEGIPESGVQVILDDQIKLHLQGGPKIGFISNNGFLRWIGEDLRLFHRGRPQFMKEETIQRIFKVYTGEPEYDLYTFLTGK